MSWRPYPVGPRVATALVAALLGLALVAVPAGAAERLHPVSRGATISAAAEAARVAAYWTPQRRREARPLEGSPAEDPLASSSFRRVEDSTLAPYSVNGRIFLRQGRYEGYCSGTAIDSPSRRLVLTAGHCVNTGPRGFHDTSAWSRYLEFVPAYTDGTAPFGAFVARRNAIYAPQQWVKRGNSNFDVGAILTGPNESGVYLADAVLGVTIALDRPRAVPSFQTFGYPGNVHSLQQCSSPAVGEDAYTRTLPGPPTVRIRCHWLPGASGGGWLIEGGTEIDGLTSYGHDGDSLHTFGPYFSSKNVGALVKDF
jgi:V8-like Glu-specific endopeptidase